MKKLYTPWSVTKRLLNGPASFSPSFLNNAHYSLPFPLVAAAASPLNDFVKVVHFTTHPFRFGPYFLFGKGPHNII